MFIKKCITDRPLTTRITCSKILTISLNYCLQRCMREINPQSDTSCELLSSTESEISECNGTLVNTSMHGNFIEYTSQDQNVHVKVLRSKDDKKIKIEKVSTASSKQWRLRVNLSEKKEAKKHMEGVRMRRKLALQRKRHKEYVLSKWPVSDTSISSKDETVTVVVKDKHDPQNSVAAHSEENEQNVANADVQSEMSGNTSLCTDHDHSYCRHINSGESTMNTNNVTVDDKKALKMSENTDQISNMYEDDGLYRSENTDQVSNLHAYIARKNTSNVMEKDDISLNMSENTDKVSNLEVNDEGKVNNKSVESNQADTNVINNEDVSNELYYVIGSPISHPKADPKPDNLSWFLDTF